MHEEVERIPFLKDITKKAREDVDAIKRHGVLVWIEEPADPNEDAVAKRLLASVFDEDKIRPDVTNFMTHKQKAEQPMKGSFSRVQLNFKILTEVANLASVRAYLDTGFNIRIISGVRRGTGKFNLVLASSFFSSGSGYLRNNAGLAIEEQRGKSLSVHSRKLDFSWLEANFYGQNVSAFTPQGQEFVHRLSRMSPEEVLKRVKKGIK